MAALRALENPSRLEAFRVKDAATRETCHREWERLDQARTSVGRRLLIE